MGMYTEMVMAIQLKAETPKDVIETLRYMMGETERLEATPDHKLFDAEEWRRMLMPGNYYFDGEVRSTVTYDDPFRKPRLTIRCNAKNGFNELGYFLDWIAPYSDTDGFVGYTMYEGDYKPILIYFRDGKVDQMEIERMNVTQDGV